MSLTFDDSAPRSPSPPPARPAARRPDRGLDDDPQASRPRCWSRSPTATTPGSCSPSAATTCALHAGQVAFPGGRIDRGEDAAAAALREAWEEIGLDPANRSICAARPTAIAPSPAIAVTPVVGMIPPDLPLAPHEHEVADWFEAPLVLRARPRQPAADERRLPAARPAIITRSTGTAAASGARPRRCSSTCAARLEAA